MLTHCLGQVDQDHASSAAVAKAWIIDTGILGNQTLSEPWSIDPEGRVIGFGTSENGVTRTFTWMDRVSTDLGALHNVHTVVKPTATSDDGRFIAGLSGIREGEQQGFVWRKDRPSSMRALPKTEYEGHPELINNKGHVVISFLDKDDRPRAFLWNGRSQIDLKDIGGTDVIAYDINNHSVAVGTARTKTGEFHAVAWLPRKPAIDLTLELPKGATRAKATHVNDANQVVVSYQLNASGARGAFLWDLRTATRTELQSVGGSSSIPTHLTRDGRVFGVSTNVEGQKRLVLWEAGQVFNLGAPAEYDEWSIVAVNDSGQWAGSAHHTRSDIWVPVFGVGSTVLNIAEAAQKQGWSVHDIHGLNDSGQILASGKRNSEALRSIIIETGRWTNFVSPPRLYCRMSAPSFDELESGLVTVPVVYGNGTAHDVPIKGGLRLTIPKGTTYVAATEGGVLSGATAFWPLDRLPSSARYRMAALKLKLDSDFSGSLSLKCSLFGQNGKISSPKSPPVPKPQPEHEQDLIEIQMLTDASPLTIKEGQQVSFSLRLSRAPPTPTALSLVWKTKASGVTLVGALPRFTASNWDQAQRITLLAEEDQDTQNNQLQFTLSGKQLRSQEFSLTTLDNDPQIVVDTHTVQVPEGQHSSFSIALTKPPTEDFLVRIRRREGDPSLTITNNAPITFTAQNWSKPQSVRIAAEKDDDSIDGHAVFSVVGPFRPTITVHAIENDASLQLTMNEVPGGSAFPSGVTSWAKGALIRVRATPSPGYAFDRWVGTITPDDRKSPSARLKIENDLFLSPRFVSKDDQDRDGMPDAWETRHFGNTQSNPKEDPDGDGFTNIQEAQHQTDPTKSTVTVQFVNNLSTATQDDTIPVVLKLSGPSEAPVSLTLDVREEGAKLGTDYTIDGTFPRKLVFSPGETEKRFGLHAMTEGNSAEEVGVTFWFSDLVGAQPGDQSTRECSCNISP